MIFLRSCFSRWNSGLEPPHPTLCITWPLLLTTSCFKQALRDDSCLFLSQWQVPAIDSTKASHFFFPCYRIAGFLAYQDPEVTIHLIIYDTSYLITVYRRTEAWISELSWNGMLKVHIGVCLLLKQHEDKAVSVSLTTISSSSLESSGMTYIP